MKLIDPHGGKLIDRVLRGKEREEALAYAEKLQRVEVSPETILDVENIATGVFSPLEGFVSKEDHDCIIHCKTLSDGLPWTIPIIFPLEEETYREIEEGEDLALYYQGKLRALMHVRQKFVMDRKEHALSVYGTDDPNHPGARRLLENSPFLISGKVDLLEAGTSFPGILNLSPAEVRKMVKDKGWKTFIGFQTRNPPHRAHEYLQRTALEFADGLFIQPLIGWKKKGDFVPEAIFRAYQALISNYYPAGRVILSALTTSMRYAGPREAVFHAIIRKNFGCTHFIVGRDHAGVGNYYEKYAAHAIFDEIADLGIVPLRLCGPYYCQKCTHVVTEKSCGHSPEYVYEISGTSIRQFLKDKKNPPLHFMRPEVSSVLSEDDLIN